ncbi:retinoid-inducible serine carboxypeptidase [Octopus sinensis]|uniref:Carboxypeptidase n=1 Tax=Octopus sinensis TaxID=2607531 RepID=A0A6P7SIM6_9MOLL|nr:retinoid-inducible serine carboxypeptidase [Octopus sinensis]
MSSALLKSFFFVLYLVGSIEAFLFDKVRNNTEWWGYVNVRPQAYMFYWMYEHVEPENRPLILWLQGGPGASSVGFGNFMEIGPLDINLQHRKYTWLTEASLLFIDNPVGSGFSYVTSDSALAKDVQTIAHDLITTLKTVLKKPLFRKVPLYIFSESYGGKMASVFSLRLWKAIQNGELKCNFRGLAMGDSWIDPSKIVLSWAPFLHTMSLVDENGRALVNRYAEKVAGLVKLGQYADATRMWRATENVVANLTGGVNWYNILQWSPRATRDSYQNQEFIDTPQHIKDLFWTWTGPLQISKLSKLMNTVIRKKLGVIPSHVVWGSQAGKVFVAQVGEFMRAETKVVNELIRSSRLKVVVYSGQLDLIVATLGTEKWVEDLDIAMAFKNTKRRILVDPITQTVMGYKRSLKNFSFYWMLNAGHMIPSDNPTGALQMVKLILA